MSASSDQVGDTAHDQKGTNDHQHDEHHGARVSEQPRLPGGESLRGALRRGHGDNDWGGDGDDRGQGEDDDRGGGIETADVRLEDLACRRQRERVAEHDRADGAREGVEFLEPKSWPWRTKMAIAPIAAIAISHPTTKASARRRPDGMLSRTITVTTETGLVNATASPSAATSATSVPICHRPPR